MPLPVASARTRLVAARALERDCGMAVIVWWSDVNCLVLTTGSRIGYGWGIWPALAAIEGSKDLLGGRAAAWIVYGLGVYRIQYG